MKRRMRSFARANTKVVVAATVAVFSLTVVGIATPAIGGPSLKKVNKKIKKLSKRVNALANQQPRDGSPGAPGNPGAPGAPGQQGATGATGTAEYVGEHWYAIARNNIGSPRVELQSGPFGSFGVAPPDSEPPYGIGSLGIGVSDNAVADPPFTNGPTQEKATFGNEVDFLGDHVTDIDELGFHVFQTGENANIGASNMPNITFEVDPNLDGVGATYSSLVWLPGPAPVTNQWSDYMDATATGTFYFTNGASATATGCSQGTPCSFAALQAALAADDAGDSDPTDIYTFGVGKGRDNAWFGAIDGLRLNDTVYDFEPFGVVETSP